MLCPYKYMSNRSNRRETIFHYKFTNRTYAYIHDHGRVCVCACRARFPVHCSRRSILIVYVFMDTQERTNVMCVLVWISDNYYNYHYSISIILYVYRVGYWYFSVLYYNKFITVVWQNRIKHEGGSPLYTLYYNM